MSAVVVATPCPPAFPAYYAGGMVLAPPPARVITDWLAELDELSGGGAVALCVVEWTVSGRGEAVGDINAFAFPEHLLDDPELTAALAGRLPAGCGGVRDLLRAVDGTNVDREGSLDPYDVFEILTMLDDFASERCGGGGGVYLPGVGLGVGLSALPGAVAVRCGFATDALCDGL
jgi:hypothetical protein